TDINGNEVGNSQNITVTASDVPNSVYTVTVSTPEGCVQVATISYPVIPPTFDVPNAFTPNGDSRNDDFKLVYEGNVQLRSLQVFDRWGELVYETNDIDSGWDGRQNGKDMPSDVYVYLIVLDLPEGERVLSGDLTLIR
ncbi:MAG: T9SS type B sorting domain-containing protein, partial [Bacteroidota bacterium]